jgi:hypothetical protein
MATPQNARIEDIRADYEAGLGLKALAGKHRVGTPTIYLLARAEGWKRPQLPGRRPLPAWYGQAVALVDGGMTHEAVAAALSVRRTTLTVAVRRHRARFMPVPPWVPEDLIAKYRQIAGNNSEDAAARWARSVKAEREGRRAPECRA